MHIHPEAFIHPLAVVIGNVTLGARTSIWPTAVLRGDSDAIVIGEECNVQDGAVIHADPGLPTTLGARVSVGHRAIVHGATVEDDCLVAMGAILLNGVEVGRGSLIAAGAVCREGMRIPPDSVVVGIPARVAREATSEIRERIERTWRSYLKLQAAHRDGVFTPYPGKSGERG
jgi:carbonic anhydrase/acetyltransferase-like protein (isoleucine patch superfamily)